MSTTPFDSGWTLRPAAGPIPDAIALAAPIPASVPGSVHTDLLAAGLIEDPYLDDNEHLQSWIGRSAWTYQRIMDWSPDGSERQELVFEGLDTVAEIRLNEDVIASTRNMHRSYRIDVTGRLRTGPNDIQVRFSSAIREADAASLQLGYRPHANHHPYNALRKMACSFGWDWGIDTATAGIWRPAGLETWSTARLVEVRVSGTVVAGVPTATVDVRVARTQPEPLELRVTVAGRATTVLMAPHADAARATLRVPDAALWWPVGHGEAALHDLHIELLAGDSVLEVQHRRVGFRTVDIRLQPDDEGIGFELRINDELVLVRGANWIPDDAFPHRVDRARYAARLEQAAFAGVNLIRVWGGGIYESEDFFTECDERGIIAWQDFLLACAAYAEEEPLRSEIEAEAREAVARIASHPSIAVFNGNNENSWGRQDWGWEAQLEGRTWGAGYYYELFPTIVAELAPHVAYTPASPFSPDPAAAQNDSAQATMHIWDLWNEKDYPHYRDYRPRFVAEFGWQGPPTWSTLTRAITDDPLTPESPGMLVHQKAINGNDKLTSGLVAHLPLPNEMADWHWAMSLNQAVAVRTAIEWFRSLTPHCTGSIVWQLNDCWPATSWAAVDGDGRRKPLLYALRAAHAEQLVTIQPRDNGALAIIVVNDTAERLHGTLTLERRSFDGSILALDTQAFDVGSRGAQSAEIPGSISRAGNPASEFIVARLGSNTAYWFFAEYRDSKLADPGLSVDAVVTSRGWDVHVTAERLARDVTLLVDRVDPDAVVDEALVTILPGQSTIFHVVGAVGVQNTRFADPAVLRSANDLVVRSLAM